jgi:hypothetical protein
LDYVIKMTESEKNDLIRAGTRAALNRVGAFTCPYVDDDERFAAWISGYELGELRLAAQKSQNDPVAKTDGFWAGISPIER